MRPLLQMRRSYIKVATSITVTVCRASPCCAGDPRPDLLPRLAAVVRRSRHGVLVRTGCLLRAPRCQAGAVHDKNTHPVIDVDVSSASHPFYTGRGRVVDTAGRVERFRRRYGPAAEGGR